MHETFILDLRLRGDGLPKISSDGSLVAVSVIRDEESFLDIYTIEGTLQKTFEEYTNPVWSPEGPQFAAVLQEAQGYSVSLQDLRSGGERNLIHLPWSPELTWLPDGAGLLIATRTIDEQGNEKSVVYIVSTSTGEVQEIDIDSIIGAGQIVVSISFKPGRGAIRRFRAYSPGFQISKIAKR